MIHTVTFNITTDGSGNYDSSTDGGVTGQPFHISKLLGVRWRDGDLADGVDGTLYMVNGDSTITIDTMTNANDDAFYSPLNIVQSGAGVAAVDAFSHYIVDGTLKLVVASGGATKTGQCVVFLDDFS